MKEIPGNYEAGRRWPFRVLLVTVCAMLAVSLFLNCGAAALLADAPGDLPEDECPDLHEVASWGEDGPKVVRIELTGVIVREDEGSLFGGVVDPVERVLRQIRAANNDEEVEGILLEVDSPGGGVTASDEIYHELVKFKEGAKGRAVVGLVRDMAASGGYYAMLPCDEIVAQPTAIVGSVGVLVQGVNFAGLAAKAGVADMTVKSGENKDLLNPLKPVDEQQRAIVQAAVDADYERFLELVAKHRHMPAKKLRPLCDGRIFGAEEARKLGFVDRVGYREDALALLAEKLGSESVRAVKYQKRPGFLDELLGMRSPLAPVVSRLSGTSGGRREYRWMP